MTPVLEVLEAGWRAGDVSILEGIRFEVAPGELVALMGKNGAGKSTLLDIIAGLRSPATGAIVVNGRPSTHWTAIERARLVGHLPQAVRADVTLTVEQLVLMGRYPHADVWFESAVDRAAAEAAMQTCGCVAFRDRHVSTLSGGERQRVLLAACLAQRPRLLLLDEPATFLDVDQQLQCFEVLRAQTDAGAACIAVTHDINLALTFCTRIVVLSDGAVAYDAPTDGALDDPEWLGLFSSRLIVTRTPAGQPWVCFR